MQIIDTEPSDVTDVDESIQIIDAEPSDDEDQSDCTTNEDQSHTSDDDRDRSEYHSSLQLLTLDSGEELNKFYKQSDEGEFKRDSIFLLIP